MITGNKCEECGNTIKPFYPSHKRRFCSDYCQRIYKKIAECWVCHEPKRLSGHATYCNNCYAAFSRARLYINRKGLKIVGKNMNIKEIYISFRLLSEVEKLNKKEKK